MNEEQIIKYLKGQSTPGESEEIENWILEGKENADIFFEIERLWMLKREAVIVHSSRIETAYHRLSNLLRPKSQKYKLFGPRYWKYAAVALLALLITIDIFYDRPTIPDSANMIEVPKGQRVNLVLSDGTKVCLNSNSRLHYPAVFSGKQRHVELEGEAFFEVTHDEKCPFVVQVPDMTIKVLGTTFNVKAYQNEVTYVTLESGKVEVRTTDERESVMLNPCEQVSYSKQTGLKLHRVNGNAFYAWKSGEIAYVDNSLSEIVKDLERRFDVRIRIEGQGLAERKFSLRVENNATLSQILTLLKGTRQLDFNLNGEQVIIYKNELPME
ncbi:FecR family protein [Parabacteroides timonensis]|uniref:FecR family protein n=1 Tax=Parabacteroides timonensis TaxID=1871013 RepID=UPI00094EFD86|nr:FecR domain-containing protein [Parabacteroides timonensis]